MLKELIKIADFLDHNGKEKYANLIDYFIQKFAGSDPSNLKYIYNDIPKEERADFERAFNGLDLEKLSSDSLGGDIISEDKELLYIYNQLKSSSNFDSNKKILTKDKEWVKLGEIAEGILDSIKGD